MVRSWLLGKCLRMYSSITRVDEHPQPVTELRRVATIARLQLLPFVAGMPKRDKPAGGLPDSVTEMLLAPPPERPGGGGSAP